MSAPSENPERLRETIARLEREQEEYRRAEQRLALRDRVTRALGEASSLAEAAPGILRAVCETLGWQMGALWSLEPHGGLLRCVELWHAPTASIPEFEAASRGQSFRLGVGMPGRVWASAQPAWIPDVTQAENFPRAEAAEREGLRSGLGFPIAVGGQVAGVMEFFSNEIRQPDENLLEMFRALGSQIGQYIERHHAEEMLNRFFTLSLDMLSIVGFDGSRKVVNPAWERILGYSEEEVKKFSLTDLVHPEDRAAMESQVRKMLAGETTVSFEARYRAKDGSYRWLLWNAIPFVEQQLIYAAARDITERKRSEEHMQELRTQAEAATRAKSEFLARMSHEIRTPLNVVIGMGDLLDRSGLTPEQRQYVSVFQKAGSTLLELVNDILDLSKIESGRLSLEDTEFDVRSVVETTIEMMSMRARQKGLELSYDVLAGTPGHVRGDPERLRQILINLVGNAIKFTDQGQVAVRVQPDPEDFPSHVLRFTVSDTGIGIPPEKTATIFEDFTQVDASTTRHYGGTGLGLAISKRLVELMGGRIWVEPNTGGGAVFHFTAHLSPVTAASAQKHTASRNIELPDPAPVPALHVLVADDSEDNRFLMAEYLKHFGCHMDFAETGQAAVDKFCSSAYDLVLMDLQMPLLDGYSATRRIRAWEQQQRRDPTPVIAVTASALEGDMEKALSAGCTACLRKPVRLRSLIEAIAKYAPAAGARQLEKTTEQVRIRAEERLRALVPQYLARRIEDAQSMRAALDRSDFDAIRTMSHKISGTAQSYGFARMTEIAAAMEKAARDKDSSQIRLQLAELSAYLQQVEVS